MDAIAQARFWRNVNLGPGCWLWTAGQSEGYGQFNWREDGRGRVERAHRLAWRLMRGPIPSGLCVLHRCDVRRCCRLEHLFLGTRADNMADKTAKGRNVAPEPRLSDEMVRYVRYSPLDSGQLARIYGVSASLITAIRRGERRANVS